MLGLQARPLALTQEDDINLYITGLGYCKKSLVSTKEQTGLQKKHVFELLATKADAATFLSSFC